MPRRNYDRIKRIVVPSLLGVSLLAIVIYAILLKRGHEPTCALVQNLPTEMTLGKHYPVGVELTLPWRQRPSDRTASVTGDVVMVAQTWSMKSPGPGYTTWKGTVMVASMELGNQRNGVLTITHQPLTQTFELGPATVIGLLGPDELFTPTISDYSPTAEAPPYALWGALLFGILAAAGVLYVLIPRAGDVPPLSPGETLSALLNHIADSQELTPTQQHQQISDGVRDYISATWAIPAITLSKDELLSALKQSQAVPDAIQSALLDYLTTSDQGKYAPSHEGNTVADHLTAAKQFLEISEMVHSKEANDAR